MLCDDDHHAETTKKGSEKSIRRVSNVTASTLVSRYASFTKIAFVEKQIEPNKHMMTPTMKYAYDLFSAVKAVRDTWFSS